jgi:radical SAM protein with 4Fe4S-binding SPASM domain
MTKPYVWAAPVSCSIEPLNFCNLQCPECFVGNGSLTRPKQRLEVPSYQKIINQISPGTAFLTLYFQGEPLLHPDFAELVEIADKRNIFTAISTNGHLLADHETARKIIQSGLKHLIISVDGTTQETYEQYRESGNLQQVLDGIRNIMEIKKELHSKTPFVEIQFLVMRHNEHQIPEIKRITKDLHADKLTLKSAQIYNINKSDLLPANEKYNRYQQNADGTFRIKKRLRNRCWRQWSSAVITCNGDIVPCCFDKNAKYIFGNVFDNPLKEIWHSKRANDFRRAILANRKNIDICCNCSES